MRYIVTFLLKNVIFISNKFHKFNMIDYATSFSYDAFSTKSYKKKRMQSSKLHFLRVLFWTNKYARKYRPQSNKKQSFANCLAEVEELQSPISANSRCPITGAC